MELTFLGKGGAFRPDLGNTSAFFREKDNIFLIDCGEAVFERILNKHLLDEKPNLYVMITHFHTDHVGSLSSLIYYEYYACGKKATLVCADKRQRRDLKKLLAFSNVDEKFCDFVLPDAFTDRFESFERLKFLLTDHEEGMRAFNIVFQTKSGVVFYSGDTNTLKNLTPYIRARNVDKMYLEAIASTSPVTVHLKVSEILSVVPEDMRDRVYCMHISNQEVLNELKENNIKVVEVPEI